MHDIKTFNKLCSIDVIPSDGYHLGRPSVAKLTISNGVLMISNDKEIMIYGAD
jgi:hypothetical protein